MLTQFFPDYQRFFQTASAAGFPAFLDDVEKSQIHNSTPYLTSWQDFVDGAVISADHALKHSFIAAIAELQFSGVSVEAILLGGSVLTPGKIAKDLDAAIFYSVPSNTDLTLIEWQFSKRRDGLDLRLIPIDIDPIVALKSAIFFGVLYTRSRDGADLRRGMVLIDCTDRAQS